MKRLVAFLVPSHNEELVISPTLESIRRIVKKNDIYVVNDGSSDYTSKVARKFTKNVLTLDKNVGKATALNMAINKFSLAKRYKYIVPFDADTKVSVNFLKETLPILEADTEKKIACVVGKVTSTHKNWLTGFRTWEYEVAQTIHKQAQQIMQSVIVCPGCSTIYRSEVFQKIQIPTGTITEDMDFTFLIHRQKIGQIRYQPTAKVFTQDPKTLADFIKQVNRWYTGFWQCVLKHNIPWGGQMLDVEVSLLALEGLFGALTLIVLILLFPLIALKNPFILLAPIIFDFLLFFAPTIIYTAFISKKLKIISYIPYFYMMRFLISLVFLLSFTRVVLGTDLLMKWRKANRYDLGKEDQSWLNPSLR